MEAGVTRDPATSADAAAGPEGGTHAGSSPPLALTLSLPASFSSFVEGPGVGM